MMVFCSCNGVYPSYLTEADSLIQKDKFRIADSLLLEYDKTDSVWNKHVRMYRQLIGLERRFVESELATDDYSMADSLVRFYNGADNRETAMSLLFLGNIYHVAEDYPSAVNYYMKAAQIADKLGDDMIQMWLNKSQGDLYFDQRMLNECIDYYVKYYYRAVKRKDMRRMALGSFLMGRVYTIKNEEDSIIYYYSRACHLWKNLPEEEKNLQIARSHLADIYIQIEAYDKAASLLTHDSLNDYNWAYWHLGQHNSDSAYVYFKKLLAKSNWLAKVEYLPIMAKIEEESGHINNSQSLYKALSEAKDSLRFYSKVEETKKVRVQREYTQIKEERDKAELQNKQKEVVIFFLSFILLLSGIIVVLCWRVYRNLKEREIVRERLLRHNEKKKKEQSIEQLKINMQRITKLEQQLQDALTQNDVVRSEKLKMETALLEAKNEEIKAQHQQNIIRREELESSIVRQRIRNCAGQEKFHLTDDDWKQLSQLIDIAYDQFTTRLYELYSGISEHELRICYLVKLDVSSINIGIMLFKSKAAIGMTRQRLYQKLTGKKGTAKQFNEFIKGF